jgi:6-pyruvoyltetrahydropterin/6-carboxytetrahydropterin synthase
VIPTSENLVRAYFEQLDDEVTRAAYGSSKLYSVKLYETERNIAEYCPYRALS